MMLCKSELLSSKTNTELVGKTWETLTVGNGNVTWNGIKELRGIDLRFTVDYDLLYIRKSTNKGKGSTNNGFGNTNFGSFADIVVNGNTLSVWNANPTFEKGGYHHLEGERIDGTVCVDSKLIIPYLKSFGDTVNVHVGDFIALNSGNKSISAK